MAYEYQGFATLGVNLNRQNYGALDISQVFTSLNDLKYYVSKGAYTTDVSTYWYESEDKKVVPYPYAGQYLALVDNDTRKVTAYILEEKADGTFDYKEVGITPIGDDKTVDVDAAGKITLHGIDGLDTSKVFVPKLVDGELVWAEPSAVTVEGLDQRLGEAEKDIGALEAKDTELAGEIEAVEKTVGEHTTAIGELEAADTALGGRIDGHDTRLANLEATVNGKDAVGTEGEDGYQPAVTGLTDKVADHETRIGAVEGAVANVYTKSQTDEKIASEIGKQAHFSAKVVTSTTEMTDATTLYLMKTAETGEDLYEEWILIGGVATKIGTTATDLTDYATTEEVESLISGAKTEIEAAYGAADQALGERIDGVQQTINGLGSTYATIEEMNKKAAQADLNTTNDNLGKLTERVGSLEATDHTHTNKGVLDGITEAKVAEWDKAEENLVKSVKEGELAVSEAGELSVVTIPQSKVTGLTDKIAGIEGDIAGKVDAKSGYGLISDENLAKLTKLSSDGTLAAENVTGLDTWVNNNRETVGGLLSAADEAKLDGISAGAQVNVIEGVSVAGGQLTPDNKIVDIPFATNAVYGVVKGAEAVNAVMINTSNQMEVHSLNVNKLVQDENTVLILNGGNA